MAVHKISGYIFVSLRPVPAHDLNISFDLAEDRHIVFQDQKVVGAAHDPDQIDMFEDLKAFVKAEDPGCHNSLQLDSSLSTVSVSCCRS